MVTGTNSRTSCIGKTQENSSKENKINDDKKSKKIDEIIKLEKKKESLVKELKNKEIKYMDKFDYITATI